MKKIIILTSVLSALIFTHSHAKDSETLAKADSLFKDKKYTQSFEKYNQILTEEKQASPAMLLKMSFIKEGLGNYTDALYFLNLYYLQTADRKVLDKMESLASKNNLLGFEFNDGEFVRTIFYKYFYTIISVLIGLTILLLASMYYLKFKKHLNPILPACFIVITLALLFYTLNFGKEYQKSLVYQNNTYLMSGPSAGSEVVSILSKGHRLDVGKQKDVWTEVNWKGQEGFIKNNKLKPIKF